MKFLTDAQTPRRFGEMLGALDHHVETIYQHDLQNEPNDAQLVAFARSFGMVFLTLDELRGEQGFLVMSEIKRRGGKVISIHGGPQQGAERALGKLLFHWRDWYPLVSRLHGILDIYDLKQKVRFVRRDDIVLEVSTAGEAPFDPYLNKARRRTRIGTKRRPAIRHDQPEMDLSPRPAKAHSRGQPKPA